MTFHRAYTFIFILFFTSTGYAADIDPFIGSYTGSATLENNGEVGPRDMSVDIRKTDHGFNILWKTIAHKKDGRITEKTYDITFLPSGRAGIYSSAMGTSIFGKPVPLDPMKGDPYVWSRITKDTFTVYALIIDENGGYEIQEYNRTLAQEGLDLNYLRIRNGIKLKNVQAILKKQ